MKLKKFLAGVLACTMTMTAGAVPQLAGGALSAAVTSYAAEDDADNPSYPGGYDENDGKQGVKADDVTVAYGTTYATVPLYLKNIKANGIEMYILCSAPLTIVDSERAIVAEETEAGYHCIYVSGEAYSENTVLDYITVKIDEDAEPGQYPVNININSMGYMDEYYGPESCFGMTGYITIEEENSGDSDYDDDDYGDDDYGDSTDEKFLELGEVKIQRYTTTAEIPLKLVNLKTKEFEIELRCVYPLTVVDIPGAVSAVDIPLGKRFSFKSDEYFPTDEPVGYVKVAVEMGAEANYYGISGKILNIDDEGVQLENIYCRSATLEIEEQKTHKEKKYGSLGYYTDDIDNDGTDDYVKIISCDLNVENVDVPEEIDGLPVRRIEYGVFMECSKLRNISFPDTVDSIGGSYEYCNSLKRVMLPSSIKCINGYTFEYSDKLIKADIPESVEYIGRGAFAYTRMKNVVVPKNVKVVDDYAFFACKYLKSIVFENPDCLIEDSEYTICSEYFDGTKFDGIIYGHEGSTAQAYAKKYNYTFKSIDEYQAPPEYIKGDISGNDKLDIYDAIEIAKAYIGTIHFTDYEKEIADINNDKRINLYDAIIVAKRMLGK